MSNVLQLELRQYIENHHFSTDLQDNGVIIYIPVTRFIDNGIGNKLLGCEAIYVESYREARQALGY